MSYDHRTPWGVSLERAGARRREHYKRAAAYGFKPWEIDVLQLFGCRVCQGFDLDRRLAMDHDHDTGKFRGLLCHLCNVAVGAARDDPHRLRAMASYLEVSHS